MIATQKRRIDQHRSHLTIRGKKLAEIITSKEKIEFQPGNNRKDVNKEAKRLDVITISSLADNKTLKSYQFEYGYFDSYPRVENISTINNSLNLPETDEESYRLRLDRLIECDSDGNSKPPYVFTYNTGLPRRNSFQQDWWGFFNGKSGNDDMRVSGERYESIGYMVPQEKFLHTNGVLYDLEGSDRTPADNISVLSAGMLTEIEYPTGGSVEFIYEPHNFYFSGTLPPEIVEETILLPSYEGLGLVGTFEVKDFSKFFKIQFTDVTSTTHIKLTRQADNFSYDFNMFEGGSGNWEGLLDPGVYSFNVDDPAVEPESISNRYLISASYSTYSYKENLPVTENQVACGGVRIKRIINHDTDVSKFGVREFTYTKQDDSEVSSGVLVGGLPDFNYRLRERTVKKDNEPSFYYYVIANINYHVRNSSPCNHVASYTQGSPVGYSEVEVKYLGDLSGKSNGKVRYFYNIGDVSSAILPYPFPPTPNKEYLRGKLLKELYFDTADNLLKKKVYDYSWISGNQVKVTGVKMGMDMTSNYDQYNIENNENDDWYNFNEAEYYLKSDYVTPTRTIETQYFDGDSTQVISEFAYGAPNRLDWRTDYNSLGECLKTSYMYPETVVGTELENLVTNTLVSRHMISVPLREEQVNLTKNKVIQGKQTDFDFIKGNIQNGIVPRKISIWEKDAYQEKINFDSYKVNGQLQQFHKTDNIPNVYLWGYDQHYPVAKITNAIEGEVFFENYEELGTAGQIAGGHTGNYCYSGDYHLTFTKPNDKEYLYSYWYKQSGEWYYSGELDYTGTIWLTQGEKN